MRSETERWHGFSRRAAILGLAKLGLGGLIAARLYHLQVVAAEGYALRAAANRIDQRLIAPARGRILDRAGRPLAENAPTYRVAIVPEQAGDVATILERLARLITLSAAQRAAVLAEARRRRPFAAIPVRDDLDWSELSRVAIWAPDLPGVTLDSGLRRTYPAGAATAHLVGYVGPPAARDLTGDPLLGLPDFRIGRSGVEQAFDARLRGAPGLSQYEVNALGREIRELQRDAGRPGADVALTIDLALQEALFARLATARSASGVVLDLADGAIRALVSQPSFAPQQFGRGYSRAAWTALAGDPTAPLVNKAISGLYPPGSTFKMVVALAALEAGVVDPALRVFCPGHLQHGRQRFHCWRRGGHGALALEDALARSCDVYFYEVAGRVGVVPIAAMARRLGCGQRFDLPLAGEQAGLVPDEAWKRAARGAGWLPGETLITGIGQGYLQTTPLQLAVMTARLATGSALVPHLVPDPGAAPAAAPAAVFAPLGLTALDPVRRGMVAVVNGRHGTARAAALPLPEIAMAGKTGTSQVRRILRRGPDGQAIGNDELPWHERDHALFVGYAPAARPRYAAAVVVEHGGSGSQVAAPIVRDILWLALRGDAPVTAAGPAALRADGRG